MASKIQFIDADTRQPSNAGDSITVLISSDALGWDGLHIEYGYSHVFFSNNVTVPQHYFALNLRDVFSWERKDGRIFKNVTTHPGQMWVNPANIPFTHRVNSYTEFILFSIEPDKVLTTIYDVPLKSPYQFNRRYNAKDPHIEALLQTLLVEAKAGNPNGKLFLESLVTAFSIHFLNQYSVEDTRVPEYRSGVNRQQFRRVLEYIDAHLTEDISLDALAKEACMNKYHFSRQFKKATQLTPYQYVLQCRTARAKQLLEQGNLTIVEIACLLGFSDQSHLTRQFKKQYKLTPGAFLKKR